ncbi:hypothetical protein AZJ96_09030 [Streptococcus pneumoniae]|nr:hypothetical protein AZK21_05830 [Streptococcus pneumoniae]TVW21723.1 hypothetical protein AZK07_08795 [Streptococcus pneumoniae]TVX08660.1 hypothetical protein AZJ54_07885 [Streptococcus pneumoniae]TXM05174.1 hypothetical protein AZJ96_09030 [Streptococcus pneumoniae]
MNFVENKTIIRLEMIKHKARKEFTVSNLYSKIKIMKKKTNDSNYTMHFVSHSFLYSSSVM